MARSTIHGRGLFALEAIEEGTHIGTYLGFRSSCDGPHVLWVELEADHVEGRHGTGILRYLNHSDRPNGEMDGFELYALQPIDAGEEITIHYGDEWE